MKLKTFFSLLAVLFISANIYANKPETIMFSNVEKTENGCVKEFLFCDKDTNAPISKTIFIYDAEGRMLEKALYEWDLVKGWTGTQKYEYSYNEDNTPTAPSVVKWNNKTNDWSEK